MFIVSGVHNGVIKVTSMKISQSSQLIKLCTFKRNKITNDEFLKWFNDNLI